MRFGISRAALLLALAASMAQAQEKGGAPGTNVDMPFLMAPMTDPEGKLTGYAYISSRLTASSDVDALVVRDKLPFIQDALVRDVNGNSVALAANPAQVDLLALEARLLADARRVIGAARVKAVTICTVQIADLHPTRPAADPNAKAAISRCGS